VGIFLGVDGGQSGTTALVGNDEGRVLGVGRGGPCNHVSGDAARARFSSAVGGAVAEACRAAGLAADHIEFSAACFGFSGGAEDKRNRIEEMYRIARLSVTHDALIALAGATAGEPGIITIAGTGSIAFGRNRDGNTARAGGWGYVFGDEGGAFDIVRQALRAVLRWEEGWGMATALRAALLGITGASNANELMHWFYREEWPRHRVARMAPVVDACAREGDAAAREILHSAGQSLALLAGAVGRQLFESGDSPAVAYVGGVFGSAFVRSRYCSLVEMSHGVQAGPARMGPAAGALIEAYRLAGIHTGLQDLPEIEK
jgi:N-acetylglucosamine kinase-like BadF-type ATPase